MFCLLCLDSRTSIRPHEICNLRICSGSNHTGFSSLTSSIIGVCPVFPLSSPRLSTRTSNVSRIVLIQSLCPAYLRFSALMLFVEPAPMMLALLGHTLSSYFLSSKRLSFVPVTTESSPCVKPEVFLLLWIKFLELHSSSSPQFSRCPCQSRNQLLASSLAPYNALLQQSDVPFILS